uniref:N-acetyltransferase domain-containing protein n=1 Tax=Syphacia muris TaxID=451379 RepID=A0A0N5AE09_9BILA
MRTNEKIKIQGEKVVLVPYERYHVEKYHSWMEDPELRRMTGSERLSLDKEYEMQKSWREDEDKCTFILLSRRLLEIGAMIGDVNVFLNDGIAELEIMIAESEFRGHGIGYEAAQLMIKFAVEFLKVHRFQAKIVEDNKISISLFKKLGFIVDSYASVFQEYTLILTADNLSKIVDNNRLRIVAYGKVADTQFL